MYPNDYAIIRINPISISNSKYTLPNLWIIKLGSSTKKGDAVIEIHKIENKIQ